MKLNQFHLDLGGVCCFDREIRSSSNSEAATMYKLKGKSSNMQTGRGFK